MQKQLQKIEVELNQRIYKLFLAKFDGNKSAFAKASNCAEGTVRRVFRNEQSITVIMLLKFCNALDIEASKVLEGLGLKDIN